MEPFDYFLRPVMDTSAQVAIIGVCLLIALDLITGITGAVVMHTFNSEKMRAGLLHKFTELACIAGAIILDGMFMSGLNIAFEPILMGTCAYISFMEVGSFLELVRLYNPEAEGLIGYLTSFVQPKGGEDGNGR